MKLLLAVLAFVFVPPQADSFALKLEKGATIRKTLAMSLGLELEEIGMTLGGRDVPAELLEQFEMSIETVQQIQVEDEYREVEGARVKELVRSYAKASKSLKQHILLPNSAAKDKDDTFESPLLDKVVAFTWDAQEEKYKPEFRGDEGDASLLEKLRAGMDFERLLPRGEVEVGATWELESGDFDAITLPGGTLSFPDKDAGSPDLQADGAKTEGQVRYDGKREVEGRELSVFHLTAKATGAIERAETAGMPMQMSFELEFEGDYLWDAARGRLVSFAIEGPATFTAKGSKEVEVKDQKLELQLEMKLSGIGGIAGRFD